MHDEGMDPQRKLNFKTIKNNIQKRFFFILFNIHATLKYSSSDWRLMIFETTSVIVAKN